MQEVTYIALCMVLIFLGYIFNIRVNDLNQLKNILSIEVMLYFVLVGYISVKNKQLVQSTDFYSYIICVLVILAGIVFIAIYEVFTKQAWAGFLETSGLYIYRASSTLFNPNLFAFWASLVFIGFAYCVQEHQKHFKLMLIGVVLSAIAMYFSGSRTVLYLLILMMLLPAAVTKKHKWLPLTVIFLSFFILYTFSKLIILNTLHNSGWNEIAILGDRFLIAPQNLINYLLIHANSYFNFSFQETSFQALPEVSASIEGGLIGDSIDSGWLVLYRDTGLMELITGLCAAISFVARGVMEYRKKPSVKNIYILIGGLNCFLTALFMRFQIFPVWFFCGLVLIVGMVCWNQVDLQNNRTVK